MAMRVSGINSGLDTDAIVQELVSAYSKKTEKYEKEQTKLGWKQEIWKNLNTKVNSFYKSVGDMRFSGAYSTKKTSSSDTTKATISASGSSVTGTQKLHIISTAQSGYLTGGRLTRKVEGTDKNGNKDSKVHSDTKLSDLGFEGVDTSLQLKTRDENGNDLIKEIKVTKDSTVDDVLKQLREAGLNASLDESNGRIFLSSKMTGANSNFEITVADKKTVTEMDEDNQPITSQEDLSTEEKNAAKDVLAALGLSLEDDVDNRATVIEGSDARIVLNNVEYTSTSNNFTINGLSIAVSGVTDVPSDVLKDDNSIDFSKLRDDTAITLTTAVDVQGIYDKIKDFLTNYNNIINEITKLYNADSARNYEPLTDEEKDQMSDTEVEKWETKIKDSLLRRDTSLGAVMNAMTSAMSTGIQINGKDYSLSSFGIQTLGFLNAAKNEQNAYHIDGDEDDENTSGNTDKLMAAITSDPDTVVEYMKQLSTNLYKAIDKQMTATDLRSKYSIYNDKELDKQYTNYTKLIKEWEEKVSDKEDYYYKQFSNMETALAKLQSQTNSLAGLFGSN